MTIWFVSRHPGALEWMRRKGPRFDRHVLHLDPDDVEPGDTVFGSLPVNLAAEICLRGASYWDLSLCLPYAARGRELTVEELERYSARLERFEIRGVGEENSIRKLTT